MSRMAHHELQCPKCSHTTRTTVWESINVTIDPHLKEQLFAGRINMLDCGHCNSKTFINAPLLYHDMNLRYCAQFFPRQALDSGSFYDSFNVDGSLAMHGAGSMFASMANYIAQPHIVFDMSELLHYIVFRDRLAHLRASTDQQGRSE